VVTVSERFCDLNEEARAAGLFLPQDQVNAICNGLGQNPAPNQPESGRRVLNDGPAPVVQAVQPTPRPTRTPPRRNNNRRTTRNRRSSSSRSSRSSRTRRS